MHEERQQGEKHCKKTNGMGAEDENSAVRTGSIRTARLTSVVEEVELEVPPPAHELPLPLLLAERLATPALGYREEAGHKAERDLPNERLDVLEKRQNGGR